MHMQLVHEIHSAMSYNMPFCQFLVRVQISWDHHLFAYSLALRFFTFPCNSAQALFSKWSHGVCMCVCVRRLTFLISHFQRSGHSIIIVFSSFQSNLCKTYCKLLWRANKRQCLFCPFFVSLSNPDISSDFYNTNHQRCCEQNLPSSHVLYKLQSTRSRNWIYFMVRVCVGVCTGTENALRYHATSGNGTKFVKGILHIGSMNFMTNEEVNNLISPYVSWPFTSCDTIYYILIS